MSGTYTNLLFHVVYSTLSTTRNRDRHRSTTLHLLSPPLGAFGIVLPHVPRARARGYIPTPQPIL